MSGEKTYEVRILELVIEKLTDQLNALLEDCTIDSTKGGTNNLKAPSHKVYMQARGSLPKDYAMALTKNKGKQ